eukprot:335619_1
MNENHQRQHPKQFKLTAVVASSGSGFEVDVYPTNTGHDLKQKIAEETSIVMDHQVLFTQTGTKIKKLSLPLHHPTYNNDLFISESEQKYNNNDDDDGDINDDIKYSLSLDGCIYIFDKHHG